METMNDPMLLNQVLLARVHVVASLEKINVGWWQQQDLMKAIGIGELIVYMLQKEPSKFLSVTILLKYFHHRIVVASLRKQR
jgi:hypothetical protein